MCRGFPEEFTLLNFSSLLENEEQNKTPVVDGRLDPSLQSAGSAGDKQITCAIKNHEGTAHTHT